MIRSAYLRVYLPIGHASDWREHVPAARPARTITIGDVGVWDESLAEDAFRTDWQGQQWICPRRPRLRMLEGVLAFRNSYPGMVGTTLAPERVVARAAAELEAIFERDPGVQSHILTSSWHVPLRWFVAFAPDEREFGEAADASTSIRYRTRLGDARRRLARALGTLTDAGFADAVVEQVEDLAGWLRGFEADSLLELDYASVAGMFSDGELAMDETAADVAASLDALAAGDLEQAGGHYADAAGRWARAQAVAYAN